MDWPPIYLGLAEMDGLYSRTKTGHVPCIDEWANYRPCTLFTVLSHLFQGISYFSNFS